MSDYPRHVRCSACDGTGISTGIDVETRHRASVECAKCLGYGCRIQDAEDLTPRILFFFSNQGSEL
jgi:DnaJ-class molecular chaperone